ncbi:MAG TPA: hypothetical protein VFC63_24815 [Blastocatellia bacterium]|nr:hypothetical protein [Blastocatellia bacterium]
MSRAIRQAIISASLFGRRTIARAYWVSGQSDWTSEYKLHSRSKWEAEDLFIPLLKEALCQITGDLLPFGTDDTRIGKTGKKIKSAYWGRDPLGPKLHLNLKWGIRYLHTSLLLPLRQFGQICCHRTAGSSLIHCLLRLDDVLKKAKLQRCDTWVSQRYLQIINGLAIV